MNDYFVKVSIKTEEETFHWHDVIEILLVLAGTIDVYLNNRKYELKTDDVLSLNCDDVHRVDIMSKDSVYICLHINIYAFNQYMPGISNVLFKCSPDLYKDEMEPLAVHIREKIAQSIIELTKQDDGYENRIIYYAIDILTTLRNRFNAIGKNPDKYRSIEQFERVWEVFEYLYANYTRKLTLGEVSQHVHVSEAYLSHTIKDGTGMSFEELLNFVRSECAVKLLITSDMSITAISYECGFSAPKYFNSFFLRFFKCTPSEYRKQNKHLSTEDKVSGLKKKDLSIESQIDLSAYLGKLERYIYGGLECPPNIENRTTLIDIDLQNDSQAIVGVFLNAAWRKKIKVKRASDLLRADVRKMIEQVQREIKFDYVEIQDLLGVNFIRKDGEGNTVLWDDIRQVIDVIINNDGLPWIVTEPNQTNNDILCKVKEYIKKQYGEEKLERTVIQASSDTSGDATKITLHAMTYESRHLLFDTAFSGPYFAQAISKDEKDADLLENCVLFDSNEDTSFNGQLSLFTSQGLCKPLYFTLQLLKELSGNVIMNKDDYILAKNDRGIQILTYNVPDSVRGKVAREITVEEQQRYGGFLTDKDRSYNIVISGLQKESCYLITRKKLGRMSGSILDSLGKKEVLKYLDCEAIEILKANCHPRLQFNYFENCENYNFSLKLEPNALELIEIKSVSN
jgi:AraC-like DNA-binding protein/beta-xylosidase